MVFKKLPIFCKSVHTMSRVAHELESINIRLLDLYKRVYGDLRIAPNFVISKHKHWPAYFHGYKLGKYVTILRKSYKEEPHAYKPEEIKIINDMGFVWDVFPQDTELLLFCFKEYYHMYRHCEIPLTFVIPETENWPEVTWGIRLGEALHGIRTKGNHKGIHNDLKKLGLNFRNTSCNKSEFERVYDAIVAYKQIEGTLKIHRKFIVPDDDDRYPPHTKGIQLGYEVHSIRTKGRYSEHLSKLEEVGIQLADDGVEESKFNKIFTALQTYKTIHGNLLVPDNFEINIDVQFPESTWNMKLGKIVSGIRKKRIFLKYRPQLEELGFVYTDDKHTPLKEIA